MSHREVWMHGFPIAGQTVATARQAEAQGFDGLLLADSQNLVADVYVELALAVAATERLQLGTGNTNPVTRHPSVTASAIASIQSESGGRAVLGIGRGDSSVARIGQPAASVDTLARYLAQVQGYLRGETVDLDGAPSQIAWIAAAGQPKVPVDVAATGPRVIAVGARLAERVTFTVGAEVERVRAAAALARAERAAAGLDPETLSLGAYVNVAVHPDVAVARGLVRGSTAIFARFSSLPGFPTSTLPASDRREIEALGAAYDEAHHGLLAAAHSQVLSDEFVDRFAVVGPAEHCRDRLAALFALGLDHIVYTPGSRDADSALLAETTERFAHEVLPALHAG
jgi:5,10-methylenetetrahydromethanopterin reductase